MSCNRAESCEGTGIRLAGTWEAVGRFKHIDMEISEPTIVGHVPTATGTNSDSSERLKEEENERWCLS